MIYNVSSFNSGLKQSDYKSDLELVEAQAKDKLAQLLKEIRSDLSKTRKPISSRELARRLDVSNVTVLRWEDRVALPDPENLQKIANLKNWDLPTLMSHIGISQFSSSVPKPDAEDEASLYLEIVSSSRYLSNERKISLIKFLVDSLSYNSAHDKNNLVSKNERMSIVKFSLVERNKLARLLGQSLQKRGYTQKQFAQLIGAATIIMDDLLSADESLQISEALLNAIAPYCYRIVHYYSPDCELELDTRRTYSDGLDLSQDIKKKCCVK